MNISEMLIRIANNEQALINELKGILAIQEECLNPKITFTVNGKEMTILDKNAYWDERLGETTIYSEEFPYEIADVNGYAACVFYTIKDSNNKYVKYGDRIRAGEKYAAGCYFECTILGNDRKSYTIEFVGPLLYTTLSDIAEWYDPTRFHLSEDSEDVYFTPEENGPTYLLGGRDLHVYMGDTIDAVLVEGVNQ